MQGHKILRPYGPENAGNPGHCPPAVDMHDEIGQNIPLARKAFRKSNPEW